MHKLTVEAKTSGSKAPQVLTGESLKAIVKEDRKLRSTHPQVVYALGDSSRPRSGSAPNLDTGKLQEAATAFVEDQKLNVQVSSSSLQQVNKTSSSSSSSDVESETQEEDMAEDKSLLPQPFTGKLSEDADDFFRQFEMYAAYKELTAEKQFALFKVLLAG